MFQLVKVVVLLSFCNQCLSARILGFVSTASYSHQIVFHPLWKELSLRGHQVTVLAPDLINNSSLTNLREIDLHDIAYTTWNNFLVGKFEDPDSCVKGCLDLVFEAIEVLVDKCLDHPEVKTLINDTNTKFDLVMLENLSPIPFAFAKRFNCPSIVIHSFPLNDAYSRIGNPTHPIVTPDLIVPVGEKLTFMERLDSLANDFIMTYIMDSFHKRADAVIEKHFGQGYPSAYDLVRNSSAMFVNSDFVFHPVRPLYPNIIQMGGGMHLTPPAPLPKDLKKVLDAAKQGFIYFSLGSNVKSKDISPEMSRALLETFSELPYTILWKFELDKMEGKPDNVVISKWFPQQDVLRHPNIKLFITQGGLQSIEEAIHYHVPMVGIPFFADQPANVRRILVKGMGLAVYHESINKDEFKRTILEVINNPKYCDRMQELSHLVKDQPMTGLERAVWWTEYIVRNKGARHLRSPALDIPLYQYYFLDVVAFCLLIILIVLYVVVKTLKLLLNVWRYLFSFKHKEKSC